MEIEDFSKEKLAKLVFPDVNDTENKNKPKLSPFQYIRNTLFKTLDNGVFYKSNGKWKNTSIESISKTFIPPSLTYFNEKSEKIEKLSYWFLNRVFETYEPTFQRLDSRQVFEANGKRYINFFTKFPYEVKPTSQFSNEIKQKSQMFLDHLLNIWCSGKEDQYQYVLRFIGTMLFVRKVKAMLMLIAGQGVGKSIIFSFLEKMIGSQKTITKSNLEWIGAFNYELANKVIVFLEEIKVPKSQDVEIKNTLKEFITGKWFELRQKFKDSDIIPNVITLILASNYNPLIIDADERRLFPLDMSQSKQQDREYFDKLSELRRDKEVIHYLFCFFYEMGQKAKQEKWKEKNFPKSDKLQQMKAYGLHPIIKAVKSIYLERGNDFITTLQDLTLKINEWISSNTTAKKMYDKRIIREEIEKQLKITPITKNIRQDDGRRLQKLYYQYKYNDLYKIFNQKGWILKDDEIPEPEVETQIETDEKPRKKLQQKDVKNQNKNKIDERKTKTEEDISLDFLKNLKTANMDIEEMRKSLEKIKKLSIDEEPIEPKKSVFKHTLPRKIVLEPDINNTYCFDDEEAKKLCCFNLFS